MRYILCRTLLYSGLEHDCYDERPGAKLDYEKHKRDSLSDVLVSIFLGHITMASKLEAICSSAEIESLKQNGWTIILV